MKPLQIVLLSAIALTGTALFAAEKAELPKDSELAKKAETARTAADHAAVAKAYRERAEALADIAEKHEAEVARKQNGPQIGMAAKWPAMARNSVQREKQKAIEARRAARESEQLAALHTQLAVEAGFAGSVEAKSVKPSSGTSDGSR